MPNTHLAYSCLKIEKTLKLRCKKTRKGEKKKGIRKCKRKGEKEEGKTEEREAGRKEKWKESEKCT